jgi:hypothetical protein
LRVATTTLSAPTVRTNADTVGTPE